MRLTKQLKNLTLVRLHYDQEIHLRTMQHLGNLSGTSHQILKQRVDYQHHLQATQAREEADKRTKKHSA